MPNQQQKTDLAIKMLALADKQGFPSNHELRRRAEVFDAATQGYYAEPQTVTVQSFMAAWAKARRTWCLYSGEPLI